MSFQGIERPVKETAQSFRGVERPRQTVAFRILEPASPPRKEMTATERFERDNRIRLMVRECRPQSFNEAVARARQDKDAVWRDVLARASQLATERPVTKEQAVALALSEPELARRYSETQNEEAHARRMITAPWPEYQRMADIGIRHIPDPPDAA